MKFSFRDDMPAEAVSIPYAQATDDHRGHAWMMVSTSLDPSGMVPVVRDQVHALAKDLPPVEIVSLGQDLQESENGDERSLTRLLGSFGALFLGLALMGLYGMVSCSVSQRVRDLAIRLALGAPRAGLLRMIVGEALRYVLAGGIVGVALALAASRMLGSFLFGVNGFDPHDVRGVDVSVGPCRDCCRLYSSALHNLS